MLGRTLVFQGWEGLPGAERGSHALVPGLEEYGEQLRLSGQDLGHSPASHRTTACVCALLPYVLYASTVRFT